jgi:hypothetical protein
LLNQGMPALDELKAKLDNAAGSAAATAKTMGDNLTGSMTGLGSAWDTVKTVLGTPVLPVLKDGVDQLAGVLRGLVADGTIAKFGESFAEAFRAGIQWARNFFDQIDFKAVVADMQAFAAQAGDTFRSIGENAAMAGNAAQAAYGVMSAGVNAVLAAVYGIGAAFAGVASNIQSGLALLYDAFAKITFGSVSTAYKLAADEIRLSAGASMAASEELGRKSTEAFIAVADSAQTARNGFAGLAKSANDAKPAVDSVAAAEAAATKELEAGAAAAAAAGAAAQKKASADQQAAQASEDNRTAIARLREEYAVLVASGSLQGAAEKLQEINKALQGTPAVAVDAAKAAADTAAQIDAAFGRLGVTSSAALKEQAANAQRDYETIKNSGTSTAQDIAAAFKVAAEKAIAANHGIAPSWVDAQAAARGYVVDVDAAGNASLTAAGRTTQATGAMAGGWRGVASSTREASQAAKEYQQQMAKKYGRPGEGDEPTGNKNGGGAGAGGNGGGQSQNQWVWTRASIIDYLKSAGIDEKLSEELAKQFVKTDGTVDYVASAAQKRWGGEYSTLSEALGKMVDHYKYTDAGKNEASNRSAFLNGSAEESKSLPSPSHTPATPAAAPTASPSQSGRGATYVSNVNIQGVGQASIKFADASSQQQTEDLLRKLAQAKGVAQ